MAVELGRVRLEHLTHVSVSERARIVRHPVPGMSGDMIQTLGRPAVEVRLHGVFYGPQAAADLKQLRDTYLARTPVDFFAEAVGEGYFAQVLITHLEVAQRAGVLDQFDFACAVVEYVAPLAPAAADPLAALSGSLFTEAAVFVGDMQLGLDQVTQLTDLIARQPEFGDPTRRLELLWTDYRAAIGDGDAALHALGRMLPEQVRRLLPDLASLLRERDDAAHGMDELTRAISTCSGPGPESSLATVAQALAHVSGKLAIDGRGLTAHLPATMAAARAALPSSNLESAVSFEQACATALDFVQRSPLARALPQMNDPHAAMWAIVDAGLSQIERRADALAGSLIGDAALGQARSLFEAIDELRSSASVQSDLHIARNLIGLSPNVLGGPADYLSSIFALLAPLDSAAHMPLDSERQAIDSALNQIAGALDTFDPANANDYDQVHARLDQLENAVATLLDALQPLYERLRDFSDEQDWGAIVSSYGSRLAAITITPERLIDRATDVIGDLLGDLLAHIADALDVDDLRQRIATLGQAIHDSSVHTTLRKARQALLDFLDQIRAAIERVPAEQFQITTRQALEHIRQQLAELDIAQIGARIEGAFEALETAATGAINEALTNKVRDALNKGLTLVPEAPVTLLIDLLTDVLSQIEEAIAALEAISDDQVDALHGLIARLEQLSFTPAANAVIGELDEIRRRLTAMNPAALSHLQKRAIKAALGALRHSHLEAKVIEELKGKFEVAQQELMALLDAIFADLEQLWHDLDAIDDTSLLEPLSRDLDKLAVALHGLNGPALMRPVTRQAEEMVTSLKIHQPGQLLAALQTPYDRLVGAVRQLDPEQWAARTEAVYAEIDRLISTIDITPRLENLESRRSMLSDRIRSAMLGAVDHLNEPPLDVFFQALRPLIADLVGALFGDPEDDPHLIDLRPRLRPASLLAPLDMVFERLADAILSAPTEALVKKFSSIHGIFWGGLDALDPQTIITRLRGELDRLATLGPDTLLGLLQQLLPELRRRFERLAASAPTALRSKASSILARFDTIAALVDAGSADSRVRRLIQLHSHVVNSLRRRVDQLDFSGITAIYARVRGQIERALPEFLRGPEPPSYDEIRDGLAGLLPSRTTGELEHALEHFLERVLIKARTLGATLSRLFESIRAITGLLDPYAFREPIEHIFEAIRAKLHSLDPSGAISHAIQDLIDGPLQAIDPARLTQRLDAAYQKALAALDSGVRAILDDIAGVIETWIKAIHLKLQPLRAQLGKAAEELRTSLERLHDRIEAVILIDLLKSLRRMLDNLGASFTHELDRVHTAFDATLAAIPV